MHRYPVLRVFASAARKRAYLWSFRVGAMTPSFYVGSVLSLLPVYGVQIPLAFLLALIFRSNLPTMVALQLITNPATAVGIYYLTMRFGQWMLSALFSIQPAESMLGQVSYGFVCMVAGGLVSGLILGAVLDVTYRLLAFEARKHQWHLPRRRKRTEDSASPPDQSRQKDP